MKLTKSNLKNMIKEAVAEAIDATPTTAEPAPPVAKQRADVAMASKKMTKAAGLESHMEKINNRVELEQFLGNVLTKLGPQLTGADKYRALVNLAMAAKKGLTE